MPRKLSSRVGLSLEADLLVSGLAGLPMAQQASGPSQWLEENRPICKVHSELSSLPLMHGLRHCDSGWAEFSPLRVDHRYYRSTESVSSVDALALSSGAGSLRSRRGSNIIETSCAPTAPRGSPRAVTATRGGVVHRRNRRARAGPLERTGCIWVWSWWQPPGLSALWAFLKVSRRCEGVSGREGSSGLGSGTPLVVLGLFLQVGGGVRLVRRAKDAGSSRTIADTQLAETRPSLQDDSPVFWFAAGRLARR